MNKLTPLQIRKISEVIALPSGMSNDPNYLSGQKLVDFFNAFGFGDDYLYPSIGIVTKDIGDSLSRQKYAFERMKQLADMGKLSETLQHFLNTINEPIKAKEKFDEIIQSCVPRIDQTAYSNIYMQQTHSSLQYPEPKTSISQFDDIKEGDIVVFISYAWDSEEHKQWVRKFSDDLRANGLYTLLDDYNPGGVSLIDFMRNGIKLAHKVLVIGSPRYKEKVDAGNPNGVNFEDQILTIELYNGIKEKHIPILRKGTFQTSFSELMSVLTGYDFSDDSTYNQQFLRLVEDLKGNPLNAAPAVERTPRKNTLKVETQIAPVDWKKIFNYSILRPEEMEIVYNEALTKISGASLSISEFARLVFTLCELDNAGIKLKEELISDIKESLFARLNASSSFDELYEIQIAWGKTMSSLGISSANYETLNKVCEYYCDTLTKLKAQKKLKLVVYLEHLTDENAPMLVELLEHAPDHGTPYSSLSLFDKVDVECCIKSIIIASPNVIMWLRKFLVERYKLVYRLTEDNNSLAFTEEIENLTRIFEGLSAHIDSLTPIARLPYIKLKERIEQSISRCNGCKSAFNL